MTIRKFYKTNITLEVMSEEPVDVSGLYELEEVVSRTITGDYSGRVLNCTEEVLDGAQAARALIEQGSDPEFFQIDKDGNSPDRSTYES